MPHGPYSPATLFTGAAAITRKQFIVSLFYQLLVAAIALQLQLTAAGSSSTALSIIAGGSAVVCSATAFVMLILASRNRLADAGMSGCWLAIPISFLVLDIVRASTGMTAEFLPGSSSMWSFVGILFLMRMATSALIILLLCAPTQKTAGAGGIGR